MFCNVIILIHHFDHIDLEREQNSFQLTKGTFEKRVPRPDKKYPYGGSDKKNFLSAMKGLTNDPKWLMVCLGREGKRKAAKTRGKVSASLSSRSCARSTSKITSYAGYSPTYPDQECTSSGGLFASILARFKFIITLLFQVGQGSFTLSAFFLFCNNIYTIKERLFISYIINKERLSSTRGYVV